MTPVVTRGAAAKPASCSAHQPGDDQRSWSSAAKGMPVTHALNPLTASALLDHARAAARADEHRHAVAGTGTTASQQNAQTLRGWGGAALLDLEWTSHCLYAKAEREVYRAAYAAEYLRRRAARPAGFPC